MIIPTKLFPLILLSLPLGGCVAAAAAGVVGSAVSQAGGGGTPAVPNPAAAREACTARAGQAGTEVRIIDALPRGEGVRVFGTVGVGGTRRSFRCEHRGDRVTGFMLGGVARAG
ncbi:MAG TPA: hypothetical protein VF552_02185 [Allosphingosinicella sp.]|jgi:hypothetical protein